MAPELRAYLTAKIHSGVQAFADLHTSEIDLVLPEKKIALLQLGVFDNGESAQSERARLAGLGVPCAVWQDARMRLIADAASKRKRLRMRRRKVWPVLSPKRRLRASMSA